MDIAWILLSVIFLIFIIVLFLNKKRKDRPNQEINLNEQVVINQSNTDSKIIPSHRISLDGNDISLKKVLLLFKEYDIKPVSYTHLRAHETREDRVCPRGR